MYTCIVPYTCSEKSLGDQFVFSMIIEFKFDNVL